MEPNLERKMMESGRSLKEFFEERTLTYLYKTDKGEAHKVQKKTVVTCNPTGLIDFVKEQRGVTTVRKHLGIDGGGGFLKICLNVIEEGRTPTQSPVAKKPPIGAERFLDTGVKKLFIVAIVANVQEKLPQCEDTASGISSFQHQLLTWNRHEAGQHTLWDHAAQLLPPMLLLRSPQGLHPERGGSPKEEDARAHQRASKALQRGRKEGSASRLLQ